MVVGICLGLCVSLRWWNEAKGRLWRTVLNQHYKGTEAQVICWGNELSHGYSSELEWDYTRPHTGWEWIMKALPNAGKHWNGDSVGGDMLSQRLFHSRDTIRRHWGYYGIFMQNGSRVLGPTERSLNYKYLLDWSPDAFPYKMEALEVILSTINGGYGRQNCKSYRMLRLPDPKHESFLNVPLW